VAINTAGDLVTFALRASGVSGVGQTPRAEDSQDGLDMLNMLLAEWQLNRWLVFDLVEAVAPGSAVAAYTVGATGAFVLSQAGQRPDRIDSATARLISTGADTALYPFMAREGYDRVATKALPGPPEAYFYDATAGATGTVYFYPVPDATWSLRIKAKASLGQFSALTDPITLPLQYKTAMLWNLAQSLRPIYGLADEPSVSAKAAASLMAIGGAGAQMAQAQMPMQSHRAGNYSHVVSAQPPAPQATQ